MKHPTNSPAKQLQKTFALPPKGTLKISRPVELLIKVQACCVVCLYVWSLATTHAVWGSSEPWDSYYV